MTSPTASKGRNEADDSRDEDYNAYSDSKGEMMS